MISRDKIILILILILILLIIIVLLIKRTREFYTDDKFEIYASDDKYYPNYKMKLSKKRIMVKLLKYGDDFFTKHDINYSIAYGTMLGYVRNKKIIPYDHDLDCFISRESFPKLIQLAENKDVKDVMFNTEISLYKPDFKLDKVYVVLNKSLLTDNGRGPRYSCDGKEIKKHHTKCAFNGIMGRFICKNIQYDLFPYFNDAETLIKNNLYPTKHSDMVVSFKHKPIRDKLEDIEISVFPHQHCLGFLQLQYGKSFMTPDK